MAGTNCNRPCGYCGSEVVGRSKLAMYCNDLCRRKAREGRRVERHGPRKRHRAAECGHCGQAFLSRSNGKSSTGWTQFCSHACRGAARTARVQASRLVVVSIRRGKCSECSRPYRVENGSIYCSDKCRASAYGWKPAGRACHVCGVSFTQERRWQRACSVDCEEEVQRRMRRVAKSRRRARIRSLEHESIDPVAVFTRDGWKCQLCGVSTPKRLRGTYEDRAPELDHVVPLAAGGGHTWGNVQCACRKCNGEKGGRPLGQLGLPLAA